MLRRGFLKALGIGTAGLVVAKSLPESAPIVLPTPNAAPQPSKNYLLTMPWFMKELGESFKRHLGDHKTTLRSRYAGLTDRKSVHVNLSSHGLALMDADVVRKRYVEPVATTLAASVRHLRLKYLATMDIASAPQGGATYNTVTSKDLGISLACVEQYDIATDMTTMTVSFHGARA